MEGNEKLYTFVPGNEIRALAQICQYPNENPRHSLAHFDQYIKPTVEGVSAEDFKDVEQPVLMIHGTKDRVHSLEGAKKWAKVLPKGQLAQIEIAGHLPWMDAQAIVFNTIRSFLRKLRNKIILRLLHRLYNVFESMHWF